MSTCVRFAREQLFRVQWITSRPGGVHHRRGRSAPRLRADYDSAVVINDLHRMQPPTSRPVGVKTAIFDVCDSVTFDAEIDKAVERHEHIDILINNAASLPTDGQSATGHCEPDGRMEGRIGDLVPPNSTVVPFRRGLGHMIECTSTAPSTARAALRHIHRLAVAPSSTCRRCSAAADGGALHYATARRHHRVHQVSPAEWHRSGYRSTPCAGWIDTPAHWHQFK